MAKLSNVQRTLAYLRERKIIYSVASWYGAHDRKRHDLIGVLDYIGFERKNGKVKLLGIQVCSRNDFAAHIRKIESSKLAKLWVESGNVIFLIGWGKLKSGWIPKTKLWCGGDHASFLSTPISKPSKSAQLPDIASL